MTARESFRVPRRWVMSLPGETMDSRPLTIGAPYWPPFSGIDIVDDGDADTMLAKPGTLASNAIIERVKRESKAFAAADRLANGEQE